MGFFSSNKAELRASELSHGVASAANVIRSRFYGKGKERERTAFNDLGNGTLAQDREPGAGHSTHSGQNTTSKSFGRASGRKVKASTSGASSIPSSSGHTPSVSSRLFSGPRPTSQHSPLQNSRTSADTITMTLAQRLGELATANEQGLLDDDEYRLLRANLFERFTNVSTAVPSEAPIVRLSVSSHQNLHIPSSSLHATRPSSVHSKASIVSTFSGLLRRVSSRRLSSSSGSQPPTSSDSMIPLPTSSTVQNRTFPRRILRREASDSSLGSEVSARRISEYQRSGTPTSRKSRNPPPSSYSFKSVPHTPTRDVKYRPPPDTIDLNGEHTQSVKELRAEIETVEAEGRRLLDAFNGLELSTLTKRQRRAIPLQMSMTSDPDSGSIHSGRSASLRGPRQVPSNPNSQPLVSQPITLSRKNSLSSMSSRGKSISGSHHPLPSTSSNSLGKYGAASGSTPSVNNAGFPTLETVDEGSDPALATLEGEMADIRRRRAEVVARYEAKLELLRAKLKGAEMHEKLLKR